MRLTGGIHNRRFVTYPRGIRPTSDKVREAIFGILRDRVAKAAVLDLYAGSGALGLEALSRGAASLTTVDSQSGSVSAIRKNAAELHEEVNIVFGDVARFISKADKQYDLIFLDPPYEEIRWEVVSSASDLLGAGGLLVVEYSAHVTPPEQMKAVQEAARRRFGDTQVSFFQKA